MVFCGVGDYSKYKNTQTKHIESKHFMIDLLKKKQTNTNKNEYLQTKTNPSLTLNIGSKSLNPSSITFLHGSCNYSVINQTHL